MNNTIRFHFLACLLVFSLLMPVSALAGQTVIIDKTVMHDVYGNGDKPDGERSSPADLLASNNNSVQVQQGGVVNGFVFGGYESSSGDATASNNSVRITGGEVTGFVFGGSSESSSGDATARNNSVTITGGHIGSNVMGGFGTSGGTATVTGNSVSMSGGHVVGNVTGGSAEINASGTAIATGNSVTISGGTVGGDVSGGHSGSTYGTATATNNSVTISGGHLGGDVVGGISSSPSNTGTATNNSVTLMGNPTFGGTSGLFGGLASATPGSDGFTGNTLNVWNYQGSAVASVQGFEFYNFAIPANAANGYTLLTVTGTADMNDSYGLGKNASVSGVNIMGGGTPLQAGDRITLLRANTAVSGALANDGAHLQGRKGVSLLYDDISVHQGANELFAQINSGPRLNPQTKALSEGRLAGMAFVNQGADLVSGAGMGTARNAGSGLGAFLVGQGGTSRYDTGSHVDVDGFSLMAGIAWNQQTDYGKLLLGAFFEGGWGNLPCPVLRSDCSI